LSKKRLKIQKQQKLLLKEKERKKERKKERE
jgi:hypothetical protein